MSFEHRPDVRGRGGRQTGRPDLRHAGDPQQFLDAAEFLEFALMQHRDPIADVLHVREEVGAHDHGLATGLEVDDQVLHLPGADRVEPAGGFVEDHEFWIVDQRLRHADPPRHALGILTQLPLPIARQPNHLDQGRRPPPPLLGIHAE